MLMRRTAILSSLAALGSILAGRPTFAAPSRAMRQLDTDSDGTVDLDEAKKSASTLFDKLDHDSDGTLDRRELRGRLSTTDFAAADPDKDGTLSKEEYLKIIENRF